MKIVLALRKTIEPGLALGELGPPVIYLEFYKLPSTTYKMMMKLAGLIKAAILS